MPFLITLAALFYCILGRALWRWRLSFFSMMEIAPAPVSPIPGVPTCTGVGFSLAGLVHPRVPATGLTVLIDWMEVEILRALCVPCFASCQVDTGCVHRIGYGR
jgi:hypothetical protein